MRRATRTVPSSSLPPFVQMKTVWASAAIDMRTPVPYEEAMDQSAIFAPSFAMILLKNLFEIPTLFYGFALYLYVTHQVDRTYLGSIVDLRGVPCVAQRRPLHDHVVLLRFWLYCISTTALWFMAIRGAIRLIG